eukprot:Partr_v1_DN24244_c0_g1_i1_m36803 putative NADH dehydrogenase ubiquinone complex I, assembly factor 7
MKGLLPLIKDLTRVNGPLSISQFMRLSLTHPTHGYYSRPSDSVFGRRGDFVTSPEISQLFGELCAVFLVSRLCINEKVKPFSYVELGPGTGTLMADILRTWKRYPAVFDKLQDIHLVERGSHLRDSQARILRDIVPHLQVHWHDDVSQLPDNDTQAENEMVLMAHEFFDALPIHQFQLTEDGWREVLIDYREGETGNLAFGLSSNETAAVSGWLASSGPDGVKEIGTVREWSPESGHVMHTLGQKLKSRGGVGLVVDYGNSSGCMSQSFRAIQNHKFVHPLTAIPGTCDLTADVDFKYLSDVAGRVAVEVQPVITQQNFLFRMGSGVRMEMLLRGLSDRKVAGDLMSSYLRLVDKQQMGALYKFLCISSGSGSESVYPFSD